MYKQQKIHYIIIDVSPLHYLTELLQQNYASYASDFNQGLKFLENRPKGFPFISMPFFWSYSSKL